MDNLKQIVKEKYSAIAENNNASTATGCTHFEGAFANETYTDMKGYQPEANLGLGCGLPVQFAGIQAGNIVLDLGSGAGNDCFVARAIVGEQGYVAGIDIAEPMIEKARSIARAKKYFNMDFIVGDVENLPVNHNMVDVVISNCVLNLVPDKPKVFSEIFRVLKAGGHFCISDIVMQGQLPEEIQNDALQLIGCISGVLQLTDYLDIIKNAGFPDVKIHTQKQVALPGQIFNPDTTAYPSNSPDKANGIFSITISANKPTGCGCCGCS